MVKPSDVKHSVNKIHIETIEGSPSCAIVEINDKPVKCVSYTIHHEACSLAEMTICAYSDNTIIEEMGIVNWAVIPRTIDEAISVLEKAVAENKIGVTEIGQIVDRLFDILHKGEDENTTD